MDFQDRHVIVTGGTGALGTALVGLLLNAGAQCHVPHSGAKAESFPHRDHPKLRLVPSGSLADEAAVAQLYESVPDLWASIHVAGGYAGGKIVDTDKAALMKLIEMNLLTSFLCSRAAVRVMQQRQAGGRIVNIAARPALEWRTGTGQTAYAASKAAVAALTAALAEEVVKDGILVNAVVPSTMDTEANRQAMPKANHANWPKVEEVAQTILFLASPDNQVTRGALVPVYGRS
ncbi:MAG: SDR family NAD(P)-dependent oxidoreductase [Bradyrhizobiaceae bacterium]|nr:SDR family NAD(P)-dependent oxidoreductase [Bradyrhizobiaceae bacterium]